MSAAIAVLLAVGERWAGIRIQWPLVWGALALIVLGWSCIGTLMCVPSLSRFAQLLDRLGATRDRWTTVLAFLNSEDPRHQLAVRECSSYLAAHDFRRLLPWKWPRSSAWLAVPVLAFVFLQWDMRSLQQLQEQKRAAAQAEVATTVQQLKKLAQQVEQAKQQTASKELDKIAEQLKRSAEQLRADATEREAANKAALRELSNLEQLVKELQNQAAQLSPEEMQALAKALEQQEETKQAAKALQSGNAAEAAKALEQAAQHLNEKRDEATAQQAEKALREAMQRLAQQRQMSQAMRQLAQQMQRGGNGAAEQMLRQLAQMLRNAQQGSGGKSTPNDKNSQQTLQSLLAALQNMKQGQKGQEGKNGGEGNKNEKGDGSVAMESFAQAGQGQPPSMGDAQLPTGRPGSEHDVGTTETPFGDKKSEPVEKGGELSLRGQLGEGESLSQLLPTAGGDDKARRRYKELYEAVLPAAQEAVLQENIPLGSRFFIRRYFEAIRPAE